MIDLVGENGENLTGDYLVVNNWNMLEYETDNIMLDLNIRTDYPMVSISDYQVDTPERALAEFLTAWEEKDWEEMANHTQLTWRARLDDPADVMRARSEFEELYGAEIMNITYVSDVTADVEFKIYFDFLFPTSKDIQTETHVARIIKEDAPYSPSIEGTWGVNPLSIL